MELEGLCKLQESSGGWSEHAVDLPQCLPFSVAPQQGSDCGCSEHACASLFYVPEGPKKCRGR
eukprot:scaffold96870_cov21-Tisochrysis_lutea.AAC.5